MSNGLFTVVILCYRHFEYLNDAIDSVLSQDYPNIEIIVSDDGSDAFPKTDVEEYIALHKRENIKHFIARSEEQNVGTVRHLNHVKKIVKGEYLVFLAGDDQLYNDNVLSSYVRAFSAAPENCFIEMAQTAMFDNAMQKMEELYMTPEVENALRATANNSSALLELLITKGACLPSTSTCFRAGFFERFGDFDEHYVLVEDYPMHMRLAKEGWIIHCDPFIAIKHRHGGISHGQRGALPRSQFLYYTDTSRMIRELQLKNISVLPIEIRKKVMYRKRADLQWIDAMLANSQKQYGKMLAILLQHPSLFATKLLSKAGLLAERWLKKLFFFCLAGWAFNPVVAAMLEMSVGIPMAQVRSVCYIILSISFAACGVFFVIYLINHIYKRFSQFPQETLIVG